jgi:hypothetical protein
MSAGRKKKEPEFTGPNVVTLDQEEFNRVCKKVHSLLMERVNRARLRKEKTPGSKSDNNFIEVSKEVFVFVHLLELVDNMTEEISDLRSIIAQVTHGDEDTNPITSSPEMFSSTKKRFLN